MESRPHSWLLLPLAMEALRCGGESVQTSRHWSPDGITLVSAEVRDPAPSESSGANMSIEATMSSEADPQTNMMCGTVFWCCYRIGCPDAKLEIGRVWSWYDFPICPGAWKRPSTRHEAWHIWQPRVVDNLYYANGETRSQCVIQEATCSYEPQGKGVCWIWPN